MLWLRREYPKIVARAKREKAEICWGDEAGVRRDESWHRGYAPRGQTPIIKIPVRRKSLSLIAAVTNQGKVRFMIYAGGITPQRLILFMRRLTKDARRKVFLILDNLNTHKAKPVKDLADGKRQTNRGLLSAAILTGTKSRRVLNGDLKVRSSAVFRPAIRASSSARSSVTRAASRTPPIAFGSLEIRTKSLRRLSQLQSRRVNNTGFPINYVVFAVKPNA